VEFEQLIAVNNTVRRDPLHDVVEVRYRRHGGAILIRSQPPAQGLDLLKIKLPVLRDFQAEPK
jgi:hypothetical protein